MPDIVDIRKYMGVWEKCTYAKGLNYCYEIKDNERLFQLSEKILDILEIKDKPMTGFSIQHIAKVDEGDSKILYSDIFYKSAKTFITPVYYLTKMVEAYDKEDIGNQYEMAGKVGRGLRAFPSFIREMDLEYKLEKLLLNAECIRNPKQDVQDHTDIMLRYNGQEYRVWSYQRTNRGLDNTTDKLLGKRRKLPVGIHILCPIDIYNHEEAEDISGWKLYSDTYVKQIGDMLLKDKVDKYSEIVSKSKVLLREYLKSKHIFEKTD